MSVESDVSVYYKGNAGLKDDYLKTTKINNLGGFSDDHNPLISKSIPQKYDDLAKSFGERISRSDMGSNFNFEIINNCLRVRFETSLFQLHKMIC